MWRTLLKLAVPIVLVGGLIGLLAYGFTRNPREIPSPLIGKPATLFTLKLFDGGELQLADLRGKVVFVNFWASWCIPCREEAPLLEAAWRRYKDRGVVFVGVNILDQEEAARQFLAEFRITYPNGPDPRSRIAIDYGVWGIPETFFIDRKGRITYKHIGALEPDLLVAKLEEALQSVVSKREGLGNYRSLR